MPEGVVTALIVAASSIICQILINIGNRKKQTKDEAEKEKKRAVEQAVKDEHLENRLAEIEEKLDQHNGYAEKITTIATDIAVIKAKFEMMFNKAS